VYNADYKKEHATPRKSENTMITSEVEQKIKALRVVAVLTLDSTDAALPLADALLEGGVKGIELTLRTPAAMDCIRIIASERPDMLVGAGTVLTADQLHQVKDAGAAFAVSPGLNHAVSDAAAEIAYPYFPGVMTPSDIEAALAKNHKLLKFFPAEMAGGIKMLKALAAPYAPAGVSFLPLGGVNIENARDYLALPITAAIGGSWLAPTDLISQKRFDAIRERAAACSKMIAEIES
jgi:2-dehydro-3-deoxyphosphogluconate aldolase/(4S)-4-hydroxy-2-oxoglutarate aldolase